MQVRLAIQPQSHANYTKYHRPRTNTMPCWASLHKCGTHKLCCLLFTKSPIRMNIELNINAQHRKINTCSAYNVKKCLKKYKHPIVKMTERGTLVTVVRVVEPEKRPMPGYMVIGKEMAEILWKFAILSRWCVAGGSMALWNVEIWCIAVGGSGAIISTAAADRDACTLNVIRKLAFKHYFSNNQHCSVQLQD